MIIKNINSFSNPYFLQYCKRFLQQRSFRSSIIIGQLHDNRPNEEDISYSAPDEDETFRVLELVKKKFQRKQRKNPFAEKFHQPREQRQSVSQDWGNVWPTARSFHPATVPLPVRMGMPYKSKAAPSKYGNAELMKIPNFLHLTPPVIERQCQALKKFCTKWPDNLENVEKQNIHFPITVTKSSYLHSSPSVRDPRSRIVSLTVCVDSLDLDEHSLDKLLRLVKDRFNPATRCLTIVADRCPLSSQNEEYCYYLLSVIYSESIKNEPWEHEREIDDAPYYTWEGSPSERSIKALNETPDHKFTEEDVSNYAHSVAFIHNEDESLESLDSYKEAVLKLIICN